jgi:hypothetical protein
MVITRAIFPPTTKVPRMQRVIQNSVGEVGDSYTSAKGKAFWKGILACILLRKNLWTGIPALSITKIHLDITIYFYVT